jgi:pyruvate/2-oxoacid:ferredoxin oxidoreductase beta subunit
MAQQAQEIPIKIQYGHDGTKVVMIFSQSINTNRMTEKEAEDMIAALQNALEKLREHKKAEIGFI